MGTINYIIKYPLSAFIYISVVVGTTFLSSIASRTQKRKAKGVASNYSIGAESSFWFQRSERGYRHCTVFEAYSQLAEQYEQDLIFHRTRLGIS